MFLLLLRLAYTVILSAIVSILPENTLPTHWHSPPTISSVPAWAIFVPPSPRFADTCPLLLPVQLQYSPLVSVQHDEAAALIKPYGFIPISSSHLDCVTPRPRAQPGPPVDTLESSFDMTKFPIAHLVKKWQPSPLVCAVVVTITIVATTFVSRYLKFRELSLLYADLLETQEDLKAENSRLNNMMDEVLTRAEQAIDWRDQTVTERDQEHRVALYFRDMAVELIEELVVIDPQEPLWDQLLKNGLLVPDSVMYGVAPATSPAVEAILVDLPP